MEEASSKFLTISGLVPIIDSHGQDSTEYSQGLSSLAKILSGGIQSLESSALKAGKKLKVALIVSEPETSESISKRSIDSSDEELMERYFLSRQYQATPQSSPLTPFKDDKEKTPESDRFLIRSCFKKEEELEKASASCSGNGKGKESRIGGDMCWRCSCKSSWVSSPFGCNFLARQISRDSTLFRSLFLFFIRPENHARAKISQLNSFC